MMRVPLIVVGIVFAVFLVSYAQDDSLTKKLTSADAKQALADHDKAIKQARDKFEKDAEAASKKLLVDLEAAEKKAAKANELDEWRLIRDIRKEHEEATVPVPVPEGGKLQIVSAFYGQNVSWLDVTDKVRQATKGQSEWSTTVSTKDWGEPAPEWTGKRTLIIRYTFSRKAFFKAVYESQEITLP